MEYAIVGAKRDTGEEVAVRIRAGDESAAMEIASLDGILVESISPVKSFAPPSKPAPSHASRIAETPPPIPIAYGQAGAARREEIVTARSGRPFIALGGTFILIVAAAAGVMYYLHAQQSAAVPVVAAAAAEGDRAVCKLFFQVDEDFLHSVPLELIRSDLAAANAARDARTHWGSEEVGYKIGDASNALSDAIFEADEVMRGKTETDTMSDSSYKQHLSDRTAAIEKANNLLNEAAKLIDAER